MYIYVSACACIHALFVMSVCERQSEKKSIRRDYATLPLALVTHAPVVARRFPHLHTEVSKSTPSAAPVAACSDKALHRPLSPGFAAAYYLKIKRGSVIKSTNLARIFSKHQPEIYYSKRTIIKEI